MSTRTLRADDGHEFDCYEQRPAGATAGIVIVQEIFGVNSHIRSVVDVYAAQGFHAVAPALFDRSESGVELEYNTDGVARGRTIARSLDMEAEVLADVAAAVAYARATGPVAVVGFCLGGTVAWMAAASLPIDAAVAYYGGGVHDRIDLQPAVPTMLHFGALDSAIPLAGVHEVTAAHPTVPVHIYDDADHGFNCDQRKTWNADASALAQSRTLAFLADNGLAGA